MVVAEVMVGMAASAAKVEAGEVEAEGVEAKEVRKAVRVAGWGPEGAEKAGSLHHR